MRECIMNQVVKEINKAWEIVKIARNANRPSSNYYIKAICDKFVSLNGDRNLEDDKAVITGMCKIEGISVVIIGISKGENLKENIMRNFGMAKPEGYKKALRVMKFAESHRMPIICLVDTPGAYCGVEAEENGEGMAIANNLLEMSRMRVPIVSVFVGEGGSGGALGLGVADKVLMLENAIYSILSPEGFASILWKDPKRAEEAADKMRLTAADLKELQVIDEVISEPYGGAHTNKDEAAMIIKNAILKELMELMKHNIDEILEERYKKFREIGNIW
ncbi:acetyl-CoA carboxylase carboxyltransferase subunit alpha [Clostridium bornimense]|nr:acetyl-CoA carboxylase carboxyltransferase subunit alpha [Clostridium bornimense]MBU5316403.1 acetyl-CoA carboxylase carboxyltransferase subunit alpha [Clostridium bornimense]